MHLYQRTDCPFCWKLRLALAELGLQYEVTELALGDKPPELAALSPTATVPVWQEPETGVVLWNSTVAMEYVDAAHGDGSLYGRSPVEQARVRQLHTYSDKVVGPALRGLVFEKRSKQPSQWDRAVINESEHAWEKCQDFLEAEVTENGWFMDFFSAADCALAARFGVAEAYGAGVSEGRPALLNWYRRVKQRPAWVVAYPHSFIGIDTDQD